MKPIHVAPWLALIALAGIAGCQRASVPQAFPQAAADGWIGAFNSGDIEGLALMYTDDAELLPPDSPIVAGHEAIQEFWKSYSPGQIRIKLSAVQAEQLGEYWFREGSYTAIPGDEGEPRVGKFIELWKKVGSAWFLYRQMWNRNAPLPGETDESPPGDEPAS